MQNLFSWFIYFMRLVDVLVFSLSFYTSTFLMGDPRLEVRAGFGKGWVKPIDLGTSLLGLSYQVCVLTFVSSAYIVRSCTFRVLPYTVANVFNFEIAPELILYLIMLSVVLV